MGRIRGVASVWVVFCRGNRRVIGNWDVFCLFPSKLRPYCDVGHQLRFCRCLVTPYKCVCVCFSSFFSDGCGASEDARDGVRRARSAADQKRRNRREIESSSSSTRAALWLRGSRIVWRALCASSTATETPTATELRWGRGSRRRSKSRRRCGRKRLGGRDTDDGERCASPRSAATSSTENAQSVSVERRKTPSPDW